jgi:putative tryptophan/tyrosine transport system substrate-binding protein
MKLGRAASPIFLAIGVLVAPLTAEAQQAGKVYRVGHLMLLPRESLTPFIESLETGLSDLGYVKGRNLIVEHRSADGRLERLLDVAAELVAGD